jgi:hypothetical protein
MAGWYLGSVAQSAVKGRPGMAFVLAFLGAAITGLVIGFTCVGPFAPCILN